MAVGLTDQQTAQINAAQAAVLQATNAYNAAVQVAADAGNKANECKAKRDAESLGWKKNNACHIDTLGQLVAAWAAAGVDRDNKGQIMNTAKSALDNLMKSIGDSNTVAQQALLNDPNFNLQTQQINSLTQQAQIKADAAKSTAAAAQKSKNLIIIFSVIAGVSLIGFVCYLIFKPKKNKNPE